MAITKTIQPGTVPTPNAGLYEFSTGSRVEVQIKVKAGKTPQAKEFPQTYPASSGKFTLTRLVINLAVPKKSGELSPIELHIRKQGSETTLAYLASDNQWVKLDTSLQGEFLVASHPDWPSDPAVGIGQST